MACEGARETCCRSPCHVAHNERAEEESLTPEIKGGGLGVTFPCLLGRSPPGDEGGEEGVNSLESSSSPTQRQVLSLRVRVEASPYSHQSIYLWEA